MLFYMTEIIKMHLFYYRLKGCNAYQTCLINHINKVKSPY